MKNDSIALQNIEETNKHCDELSKIKWTVQSEKWKKDTYLHEVPWCIIQHNDVNNPIYIVFILKYIQNYDSKIYTNRAQGLIKYYQPNIM